MPFFENAQNVTISDSTFTEVQGNQTVYNGPVHNAPVHYAPVYNGRVGNAPVYYDSVHNRAAYNEDSYGGQHMEWCGDRPYNHGGSFPRYHILVA